MDIILYSLGILLIIIGIIGCILPVLPGPPLSWFGILLLHFSSEIDISSNLLLILAMLALFAQVLDYYLPIWGTKRFGGTKAGMWGSIIGLIIGLFFVPPLGPFGLFTILGGPFLGAYIGESISGSNNKTALKAAFGSFLGFVAGTVMKLTVSIIITFYFVKEFMTIF